MSNQVLLYMIFLTMGGNNRRSDTSFEWTVPLFQHHGFHWSEYRDMIGLSGGTFMRARYLMLDHQRNPSFRNQVLALSWYHKVTVAEVLIDKEYSKQIINVERDY